MTLWSKGLVGIMSKKRHHHLQQLTIKIAEVSDLDETILFSKPEAVSSTFSMFVSRYSCISVDILYIVKKGNCPYLCLT